MHSQHDIDVPVLIAGAGPAGLTAAISLARYGIESLLVERRQELSSLPRATAVSLRTMEIMREWGLEPAVREGGVEAEWLVWRSETLTGPEGYAARGGFPTTEQAEAISPTRTAVVPQDHLEPVLLEHLRGSRTGRVALGTEVTQVRENPCGGYRVTLRDELSGESRKVNARYLIAADGAHSVIRSALRIDMRGDDVLEEAVATLFRAPLWDVLGERRYGAYAITHPEAEGIFLPAGRGNRWLYGMHQLPGGEPLPVRDDVVAERIRTAAGLPDLKPRIERVGRFRFAARIAERFRQGDAFLVGDAAHRVTPRGGTGMNSAIHDGYDLGWKLAWVLRGWETAGLLDSYERERRPVAEYNAERSADMSGAERDIAAELYVDLGGRIKHMWLPGGRTSTLDLLGRGLTLFTGPGGEPREAASIRAGAPVHHRRVDAITARGLGIPAGGALLVRPDGTPLATLPAVPAPAGRGKMVIAWSTWPSTSRTRPELLPESPPPSATPA